MNNVQTLLQKLDIAELAMSMCPAQAAFWVNRIAELQSALRALGVEI